VSRKEGKKKLSVTLMRVTDEPEMDMGWVHPWVGLGWVGLGRIFQHM